MNGSVTAELVRPCCVQYWHSRPFLHQIIIKFQCLKLLIHHTQVELASEIRIPNKFWFLDFKKHTGIIFNYFSFFISSAENKNLHSVHTSISFLSHIKIITQMNICISVKQQKNTGDNQAFYRLSYKFVPKHLINLLNFQYYVKWDKLESDK